MYASSSSSQQPSIIQQQELFTQLVASTPSNPLLLLQDQILQHPATVVSQSQQQSEATLPPQEKKTEKSVSSGEKSEEWMIQWFDQTRKNVWIVGTPLFKHCKKRKAHFSEQFPDIWYKAPYKYHMQLEIENIDEKECILTLLELNYEDGQQIATQGKNESSETQNQQKRNSEIITNNENYFIHGGGKGKKKSEVTIGPFQFNICSYKQDGRKFRMVIHLYHVSPNPIVVPPSPDVKHNVELVCCLVSPPLVIRAKKPIFSPGSKKNRGTKQDGEEDEEEDETSASKKRKPETELQNQPADKVARTSPGSSSISPAAHSAPTTPTTPITPIMPAPTRPTAQVSPFHQGAPTQQIFSQASQHPVFHPPFAPQNQHSAFPPHGSVNMQAPINPVIPKIVAMFKAMNEWERKELLGQIVENLHSHEKAALFQRYIRFQNMQPQATTQQRLLQLASSFPSLGQPGQLTSNQTSSQYPFQSPQPQHPQSSSFLPPNPFPK